MPIIWSRELDNAFEGYLLPGEKLTHVAVAKITTLKSQRVIGVFLLRLLLSRTGRGGSVISYSSEDYLLLGLTASRLITLQLQSKSNHNVATVEEYPRANLSPTYPDAATLSSAQDFSVTVANVACTFSAAFADRNLERAVNLIRALAGKS